jgi:hypothetical protein
VALRSARQIGALRSIAIGLLLVLPLAFASPAGADQPIPTPGKAKSTAEMELGLQEVFGHRFTAASSREVECGKRLSRTIVKCAISFRFKDTSWTGNGRIWRGYCNGTGGTTKNTHHVCWFDNWRLRRYDERCHTVQGHSVQYCTELVVRH